MILESRETIKQTDVYECYRDAAVYRMYHAINERDVTVQNHDDVTPCFTLSVQRSSAHTHAFCSFFDPTLALGPLGLTTIIFLPKSLCQNAYTKRADRSLALSSFVRVKVFLVDWRTFNHVT